MLNNILLIILIILIIRMIFENRFLSITNYTVRSDKIPEYWNGKRIILLSDLHNNELGKSNKNLIKAIDANKPDAIMIAGDMLIGHSKIDNTVALKLVKKLAKKYPVYYSKGNHEQKLSMNPVTRDSSYKEYVDDLERNKVHYLVNQSEHIKNIKIIGLDISMEYYQKRNRPEMNQAYLEKVIGKADKKRFNILIAHNPMYFKEYVKWGADLVLAGHVHGGIIHIPGVGGVISPQYIFFPKYDHGEFKRGSSTMILSRGLGAHTIKIRLFNLPELVIIDLKR